uniref:Secreted protein n=1 Tax=Daphnia galeata TaxID=27404 RepID=A0A8J2S183_9CRUS|nr:unnamed protein product [Daphnia galeata]
MSDISQFLLVTAYVTYLANACLTPAPFTVKGVQQSRVTNVAPTGVVCGPTGLIQPAAIQSKFSLLNSASNRESVGLAPLRPPYPLQLNAGRFDHSMVTDDIV